MNDETHSLPPLPPLPPELGNERTQAKQTEGNGPFGLGMGMKLEDFEVSMEEVQPYKFRVLNLPKAHSAFRHYYLQITPVQGLSWIKAIGKTILTNRYGLELQSAFENFKEKLEKIYGVSELMDYLMYDSIWDEPRDWMQGIENGERRLNAIWKNEGKKILPNDLEIVFLSVGAESESEGYIAIEYAFTNHIASDQEIALLEDDAL